jgi:hypothetical protein
MSKSLKLLALCETRYFENSGSQLCSLGLVLQLMTVLQPG